MSLSAIVLEASVDRYSLSTDFWIPQVKYVSRVLQVVKDDGLWRENRLEQLGRRSRVSSVASTTRRALADRHLAGRWETGALAGHSQKDRRRREGHDSRDQEARDRDEDAWCWMATFGVSGGDKLLACPR